MGTGITQKKNDCWEHDQFEIKITEKYSDGAYKIVKFISKDLPGLVGVDSKNQVNIAYNHCFRFCLPREYPQNLGKIQIVNETPLFHPRIVSIGTKACYTVNGEVDRILIDIIFNILLRPETVRPPSQFKDADWGLDASKMKWYIQYGPEKIYNHLKQQWAQRQKSTKNVGIVSTKKITILE